MYTKLVPASWLAARTGRSVDSSSVITLISSSVVSVGEFAREAGLFSKIQAILEPSATGLLMLGHLGFAFGRPTPRLRRRVNEVLKKLQQLAHGSQSVHLYSMMPTLSLSFSTHWSIPFLRTINPEMALPVNLPTVS